MWRILLFAVLTATITGVFSLTIAGPDTDLKYDLGGYGFWQFGQIVKGEDAQQMNHQWTNRALIGLRIDARPLERLHLAISPEFVMFYPFPEFKTQPQTKRANSSSYINEMYGSYGFFGDAEKPMLDIGAGIFVYKYNPDTKDFGEYLYRTGPGRMITDFDFAKSRLCGLHLAFNPLNDFGLDVLFTSELQYNPLYDFSLSFTTHYRIFNVFDIGAGVNLARLVSANMKKTYPSYENGQTEDLLKYYTEDGDSGYYSFQENKGMARISIDPKGFFYSPGIFGKEDWKIYGEIALLNIPYNTVPDSMHPAFYNDISRLVPILLGFNIPTCRVLDVLSAEIEYWPSRIPNDYRNAATADIPVPNVQALSYYPEAYVGREVGWAFYARRQVIKGLTLTGQIAYDHLRMAFGDGSQALAECLRQKGHWYWVAKIGYSF
jgi:hypothetical protein